MAIGSLIILGMILLLIGLIVEEDWAYWFGIFFIVIGAVSVVSELAIPPMVFPK